MRGPFDLMLEYLVDGRTTGARSEHFTVSNRPVVYRLNSTAPRYRVRVLLDDNLAYLGHFDEQIRVADAVLNLKAPTQPERRGRLLQKMVRKARKPVVLFIDEAHDIHSHTFNVLKRLMEIITAGEGKLSVVLVGHRLAGEHRLIADLPSVQRLLGHWRDVPALSP